MGRGLRAAVLRIGRAPREPGASSVAYRRTSGERLRAPPLGEFAEHGWTTCGGGYAALHS